MSSGGREIQEPIAVVGIGAVFPGSDTLEAFWEMIVSGRSAVREVPDGRWVLPREAARDPAIAKPDHVYSTRGCFVEEDRLQPDELEALSIDPTLAAGLDASFHVALRAGLRAWRDARLDALSFEARSRVLVVLGNIALPTDGADAIARQELLGAAGPRAEPLNRFVAGLPAELLARALGVTGGAFALDAACASSLYAIKIACDELRAGRSNVALAGGLSRPDCLYTQMGFSQLKALSPTSTCTPFDAAANGLVVGEGAGIVVLKRLSDARRQGDRIDAVIRGIGLSNDVGGSLMSPDSEGQLRALRAAYVEAGWKPETVDLIECHGTGTPVGDAVELHSLESLWSAGRGGPGAGPAERRCAIGSVKSNVGHLLTAAGAAGLIKVLLALRHRVLPPTAGFRSPAAGLCREGCPFDVLTSPREWTRRTGSTPRRAAVSAFGFGGINAHVLLEEHDAGATAPAEAREPRHEPPIAIVGMDACFGRWPTLRAFQERVLGGGRREEAESGGHRLDGFDLEVDRFRIPPRELREMLPQQLLMLHVASRAADDARLDARHGLDTGVYIGIELDMSTTNFHLRWITPEPRRDSVHPPLTADRTMGALGGIVASRVARHLRAGGPSFTVSSEETSGLKALELAVRALRAGEVRAAIAGAVDLAGDARGLYGLRGTGKLGAADGAAVGEGAAAIVLKRLDDALSDGDRIYALVRGVGFASGSELGSGMSSSDDYRPALDRAYEDAHVDPATVSYLELDAGARSGLNTAEVRSLAELFGDRGAEGCRAPCAIGSVKADVGHAGAAAGIASLVKTCLCLYHEILPPLRGDSRSLEPAAFRGTRLFVPPGPQFWLRDRADGPRRAGVSALGSGGTIAHAVLEAFENAPETERQLLERRQPLGALRESIFAIEADDPARIVEGLEQLRIFALEHRDLPIELLSRRWLESRGEHPGRRLGAAIVARDARELAAEARARMQEVVAPSSSSAQGSFHFQPAPRGSPGAVAFVFPGSGNQFSGMGREISAAWPEILRRQDLENERLSSQMARGEFWNQDDVSRLAADHLALIFGQVSTGTLVCDLVRSLGVEPDAVIGYSLGESAGLFATRAWRDRDVMLRRMESSELFRTELAGDCRAAKRAWGLGEREKVDWVVGVVGRPAEAVRSAIGGRTRVFLLIVNTPGECVIGGAREEVDAVVRSLRTGLVPLEGITTVHCDVARQVGDAYRDLHLFETSPPEGVRYYSGAWAREYLPTREDAASSILAQAVGTLDFRGVIEAAYADGFRVFLEMGPGSSATRMIGRILEGREHAALPACPAGQSGTSALIRFLAQCIAERVPVRLSELLGRDSLAVELKAQRSAVERRTMRISTGGLVLPGLDASPSGAPPARAAPTKRPVPQPTVSTPAARRQSLALELVESLRSSAAAHEAFLRVSAAMTETATRALEIRMARDARSPGWTHEAPAAVLAPPRPLLDREACLEFAVGSIGKALGPAFASIDSHPTRVRLPDSPLMLVDRILEVEGEPLSMSSGRVVTEHDVEAGAWYLDCERIPVCIAVEAGQADLFLSGYLGIDLRTKGLAVYRLLDAAVTFHREMPHPGATIRYDIRIDRFFRQGETHLFRFRFDATVDGEPFLTMRDGCAGFFTARELAEGKGIVRTALDLRPVHGKRPADWRELAPMAIESYSSRRLDALREGNLVACFGSAFTGLGLEEPVTLPSGRMRLIDRVERLEPEGGRYGLGLIRGESDIHPGDWFLECHFSDDQVMPGTLMYENCLHTLRVFLLRMGWIGEKGLVACEPIPGVSSQLKCRGQVIASTRKVTYEIAIKELGYGPEPFAIADALMYADGKPIVEMTDMSVRLTGLTREGIEALWDRARAGAAAKPPKRAVFDSDRILAFAVGKPSEAFGAPYTPFDSGRIIARLPGPPYQFLDRITRIEGCEPWRMTAGGTIEAEYDVPPGAWYFESERSPRMPFAVLLEVALQPCGWLAAYIGSALTSPVDLSFRNLGGSAQQLLPVTRRSGTLATTIKITRVSSSGGMIIQAYEFEVAGREGPVYRGDTYFGFFSKAALLDQVGIRSAARHEPTAEELAGAESFSFPASSPFPDARLRMIDETTHWAPRGGSKVLGYIRGRKRVRADEWFFKAHFHQDPVWPGSLGLEAFLQLLKVAAEKRWGLGPDDLFEVPRLRTKHEWIYRGQVLPSNKEVVVAADITAADEAGRSLEADGILAVDGKTIYQMKSFRLGISGAPG